MFTEEIIAQRTHALFVYEYFIHNNPRNSSFLLFVIFGIFSGTNPNFRTENNCPAKKWTVSPFQCDDKLFVRHLVMFISHLRYAVCVMKFLKQMWKENK